MTATRVIYWDASAVLATLFSDTHSADAMSWANGPHVHLLSSLGRAEVIAVTKRLRRETTMSPVLMDAALDDLDSGPWRSLHDVPQASLLGTLSETWPLRGAELWHLALAKTLQADLPELVLLTYHERLAKAAAGEGLSPN
jgi:hypothetical protein